MGRKKKLEFKLNPEWMLKEPLDFEYNKYTLLNYIQKCEERLNKFEIYPDFVELSLHMANIQSLSNENILLLTNKKFNSCDDEIVLKDLYPKTPRELSDEEKNELNKTILYSNDKLFDTFNTAKSIWNIVFDSIDVSVKKNKKNLGSIYGYIFYYKKLENKIYVWEYKIKKEQDSKNNAQTQITKIYENEADSTTLLSIIETYSKFNKTEYYKDFPVFEITCEQDFPIEQSIVPIMKRKIMSYIFQTFNIEKLKIIDNKI
jgi:hypothetical protein